MLPNASVTTNGPRPVRTLPRTRFVEPSISVTVLAPMFGIQTVPSGAIAPSTGVAPTFTVASTVFVAGSILDAVPEGVLETQTASPRVESHAGPCWPTCTFVIAFVAGSSRKTSVPLDEPTQIEPAANA